ncbi:eukaryotic translation initiation factor 3 subunit J-like [Diadema antillarum]|uniref:eukaryotic translation initiation factor 3 subunit J-like n=1 Tax=Diadema antillarum TaxID=105358 RepID=UPI003A8C4D4F
MADWDDDDFDPEAGFQKPAAAMTDKWEGEDEDEDVKDDWAASDDDEKEEKSEGSGGAPVGGTAFQVKKKKNKLEEALKKKEEKRKKTTDTPDEEKVELTPEEQMAERLRQQKLVEEADFELAKEAFGVTDAAKVSLDSMNPTTEEEFAEFGKLLKEKLGKLESSEHYVSLLEDVFQSCCISLEAEQVKKLGSSLTAIGNEKTKAQKALKGKKAKSKKAVLAGSGKSAKKDEFDVDYGYDGNEFDDFM